MREAFITFWKDMWESQKETNRFLKKHWKGYTVLVIVGVRYRVCIAMCDCKSKRFYRN